MAKSGEEREDVSTIEALFDQGQLNVLEMTNLDLKYQQPVDQENGTKTPLAKFSSFDAVPLLEPSNSASQALSFSQGADNFDDIVQQVFGNNDKEGECEWFFRNDIGQTFLPKNVEAAEDDAGSLSGECKLEETFGFAQQDEIQITDFLKEIDGEEPLRLEIPRSRAVKRERENIGLDDFQLQMKKPKSGLLKTIVQRRLLKDQRTPKMTYQRLSDKEFEMEPVRAEKTRKKEAKRWTAQQDSELRAAVKAHDGQNWKAIATMVTDRDHVQCLQRWKKVLQPGLIKGMWSIKEDEKLMELMSSSKPKNWADIADQIPGRTAKQCRERWSLNLDPSINRGAWTEKEDELLLSLHSKLGNRWAEIKRYLNGRTENGVKTRYKSIVRARIRDKQIVWTKQLEEQLVHVALRFKCRIDEVSKHLPRSLRGISSQAMRDHCPLLRENENN